MSQLQVSVCIFKNHNLVYDRRYILLQFCTIPLDTAKVRLQLQKKAVVGDAAGAPKYKGLLGTMATIAREEGLGALWNGIIPGLQRQCIYGGLRIGLYDPVSLKYYSFVIRSWIACLMLSLWHTLYIHKLLVEQVKLFLVGSAFVGEIPIYHKVLAALLTG